MPTILRQCLQRGLLRKHLLRPCDARRNFTVLGLESSADDTCAAVVTSDREILSNVVIKQLSQHEVYGGIHPMVAIIAHQRSMPRAVRKALDDAQLDMSQIDGVAFTRGPGIAGCLSVCSNAAKTLAAALGKPLVGVHHMQAHALTPLLTAPPSAPSQTPTFPFLTLLVSGGHTLLLLASSPTHFRTLATTADESIGRAFDKVARDLGLDWAGIGPGAALERFCLSEPKPEPEEDAAKTPPLPAFPVPFPRKLAFSYSGLHSAVDRFRSLSNARNSSPGSLSRPMPGAHLPHNTRLALAQAFQRGAVAQLEDKLILALKWCRDHLRDARDVGDIAANGVGIRHVVVSGGVASNAFLRQRLNECVATHFPDEDISLVFPPPALCTDNAAMIAWASMQRFLAGDYDDYSIDHHAKWDIEDLGLKK